MTYVATMPLFDKLIDDEIDQPFEKESKKFFSFEELQDSIIRDLSNLLNTRISAAWQHCINKITTPYLYGINMKNHISPDDTSDIQELETNIDNAIRDFEPRLIDAHARVVSVGDTPGTLSLTIDAIVVCQNHHIPLSFPMVIAI